MAALWNRWAWLFVAVVLFAGVIPSWLYDDRKAQYNGLLVVFGWALLLMGGYLWRRKPSAQQLSAGFAAHKGKILPSLLALGLLYAFAGDIVIYVAPSTTYGYAWKYNVATANVAVEKRPYNCEWETAPLGAKHCHYEAQVQAIRTGIATDGVTSLVSYDDGKTWTPNTARSEPSVSVSWTKVEE